uniref:Uncharacterized protein n=1 Tax=Siphoviridae sp. ctyjS2 TaxID=2827284 RepID=A0A8S5R3G5_9CAUD|nr:MAG TPA: hypothetical protein [Siphoviridae sp. ctyjS2]
MNLMGGLLNHQHSLEQIVQKEKSIPTDVMTLQVIMI